VKNEMVAYLGYFIEPLATLYRPHRPAVALDTLSVSIGVGDPEILWLVSRSFRSYETLIKGFAVEQ
jgi:hypothetical protein